MGRGVVGVWGVVVMVEEEEEGLLPGTVGF